MPQQCSHVKSNGTRCRANAQANGVCYFHDEGRAAERAAANRAGGQERARRAMVLPLDTPDVRLESMADATTLYAETISQTRRGQLDTRVASTIGFLLNGWVACRKQSDLEMRLAAVEEAERRRSGGQT